MLRNRGLVRLSLLAVGMGIGAALAATPGVASADSSTEPLTWVDQLLGGLAAPAQTTLDVQISINGVDLLPTTDNTATATSGIGDYAIAIGSGSDAAAGAGTAFGQDLSPGMFDSAVAIGTDSFASAGQGNNDAAYADGTNSLAGVGGFNGVLSNGDFGAAFGANTKAEAGVFTDTPSQNDVALVVDPSTAGGSTAFAGDGNNDLAAAFGAMLSAMATGGDNLIHIVP